MTHAEAITLLEQLYHEIPAIACTGACAATCGPLALSVLEARRIRRASPRRREPRDRTCPLLHQGRCTVYPVRPAICRLYGVAEGMPCAFGCQPARVLTDSEAQMLLHTIEEISQALWPGQSTTSFHDPEVFRHANRIHADPA